jgi:glucose/arabinose dehydrogenase
MGPDALDPQGLADLWNMPGGASTYSDPEFSWFQTIAPTALVLPAGSNLGTPYDSKLIVGDFNVGQLLAFPLDFGRSGFNLASYPNLADLVADNDAEDDPLQIGSGFAVITDLDVGPDGALYVVDLVGSIYRITGPGRPLVPALSTWGVALLGIALASAALFALSGRLAR